jgi:hypothetical protein
MGHDCHASIDQNQQVDGMGGVCDNFGCQNAFAFDCNFGAVKQAKLCF